MVAKELAEDVARPAEARPADATEGGQR